MEKYRVIPVQVGDSAYDTKEFEAADDFAAAAYVGMMAGPISVELQKEVAGEWTHVANIAGREKPAMPPRPEAPSNPVNRLTSVQ